MLCSWMKIKVCVKEGDHQSYNIPTSKKRGFVTGMVEKNT